MFLFFSTLAGAIFFALFVWVGATVYRIYYPNRPRPFEEHPVVRREQAAAQGERVPVGVREIRADQRRRQRKQETDLEYVWGVSEGIPESWREDLWIRRN